jgi:hypothetical protein
MTQNDTDIGTRGNLTGLRLLKRRMLQHIFDRSIRWRIQEFLFPEYGVFLDYPLQPRPRWGNGKAPHPQLSQIIGSRRDAYSDLLKSFALLSEPLQRIQSESDPKRPTAPHWSNGYFEALDAVALYALLAQRRPRRYLEVGSGNSTKFARQSIHDSNLGTEIISIDPHPRAEIDSICDRLVRKPLEDVNMELFEELNPGDFMFFDGSHRAFMNSDCTVFLLDVLSRLRPGVVVHIHDIFLPNDYPAEWAELHYSEQYLLASYLLGGGGCMEILLANAFISSDPQLLLIVGELLKTPAMKRVTSYLGKTKYLGTSFWSEIKEMLPIERASS